MTMKQHRNTRQRQIILDAVRARRDHPSADEVYQDARAADEKISRATVYRNLNILARKGEILMVRLPGLNRFDSRTDFHYHLVCGVCGAVCDAQLGYREDLNRLAAEKTGYAVKHHRMIFEGTCPNCRQPAGSV